MEKHRAKGIKGEDLSRRQLLFGSKRVFAGDTSGATAVEYGLLGAMISVAAIFAIRRVGRRNRRAFRTVKKALKNK